MELKIEAEADCFSPLCRFCLSSNRRLSPVFDDPFRNAEYDWSKEACWECVALMRRFRIFQSQAIKAEVILRNDRVTADSLSQLGTKSKLDYDYIYDYDDFIKDELKEEIDFENDCEVFVEVLQDIPDRVDHYGHTLAPDERIAEYIYSEMKETEEIKNSSVPSQKKVFKSQNANVKSNCSRKKKELRELKKITHPSKVDVKNNVNNYKQNLKLSRNNMKFDHYECDVCGRIFKKRVHIWGHMRVHFPSHLCDTCGKSFTNAHALKVHTLIHRPMEERPHACKLCSRRFNTKDKLVAHELFHTGNRSFKCDMCARSFWKETELNWHKKKKHSEIDTASKKKYARSISQYRFNPHKSKTVTDTISTEDIFPCKVCGKKFKLKMGLQQHSVSHTDDRPHRCDQCPATFKFASGLWAHKLVHAGTKDHECNICGAKFTLRSNLKGHMKIHTNEKPFSCHICNKRFPWNRNLKNHMKVHCK